MSSRQLGALAVALAAVALPALATARNPTPKQIRAAVQRAERSKDLWATVNICNTRRHRHTVGIRGQMPSLGFNADLSMDVQVNYYKYSQHRFVPDPGVRGRVWFGRSAYGRHQGGYAYLFDPPVVLSGTITFEWRYQGKLIGRTRRDTVGHVRHVDGSDPAGYSAATCVIAR